jgi:hypothetical protein
MWQWTYRSALNPALDESEWLASRPGRSTPGADPPASIRYEVGWSPERVWTMWRRKKSVAPVQESNPGRLARRYTE